MSKRRFKLRYGALLVAALLVVACTPTPTGSVPGDDPWPTIRQTEAMASTAAEETTTVAPTPRATDTPAPILLDESPTAEGDGIAATADGGLPTAAADAQSPLPQRLSPTPLQLTAVITSTGTLTPVDDLDLAAPVYDYEVVAEYPHDPAAFTQGLVYEDGVLVEGTGLRGRSSLREVDLETGQVLQSIQLPEQYFGEGVAVLGDRIYQLTWQENTGFVYDRDTFELVGGFTYPMEGWGLTDDGKQLIMSDGTSTLYFLDPETLEIIGSVPVTDTGRPVIRLNELEYVEGEVFANVWQTDWIVRIDPQTGQVLGWIDLAGLLPAEDRQQPVDVLNGIAYDDQMDRLFVTGKWWPKLFQIELVP